MTTTAESYKPPAGGTGSTQSGTPGLLRALATARVVAGALWIASGTTQMSHVEDRRRQLLVELAERSVRADAGLERDLAEQINREAWGFNGE
jgi:hypothetical protein